jgi:hypothetical protein
MMKHAIRPSPVVLCFLLFFLLIFAIFAQAQGITVDVKKSTKSKWEPLETETVASLKGFSYTSEKRNRYGSLTAKSAEATHFYRVQKKPNGRWIILDPDGCRNVQVAVCSVSNGRSPTMTRAYQGKFGSSTNWMAATAKLFIDWGFYGCGAWSDAEAIRAYNRTASTPLSYSVNLNFMSSYGKKRGGTYQRPGNTGYPNQCIFVFDPAFETFCEELAKSTVLYKDDPNLLGWFSDNEMPLGNKNLEGYLTLTDTNDCGRVAAEKWLKARGVAPDKITDAEREAFAGVVAERYYQIVSTALKRNDPNHLYLGSRLHGANKKHAPILAAAARYCDIIAINWYGEWTPKDETLAYVEKSGKPFMVTEFYTKAMDAGLANTSGAGWIVRTQKDRGLAYQNFCLRMLKSKACVGWHFFKYQDNDPEAQGVDPSNTDANKGLVNNQYVPYLPLGAEMKTLNQAVYQLQDYFDQR